MCLSQEKIHFFKLSTTKKGKKKLQLDKNIFNMQV